MSFQDKIYSYSPHFIQNALVTLFDFLKYRKRHSKRYYSYKKFFKNHEFSDFEVLSNLQKVELIKFLKYCKTYSPYYKNVLKDIDIEKGIESLSDIPVSKKDVFKKNIKEIVTTENIELSLAKTGGTTGKSMQVYFRWQDLEERFAILDVFRERFGYRFRDKTGWFSGKNILNSRDRRVNRFWKQDWLYNIRYYSTYDINEYSLQYYIDDIRKYKPKFLVGFPSSIVEIAKYGIRKNINLGYRLQGIFPTSESKVEAEAELMTEFFGCGVFDQYASSEGACFITECEKGKLHFEMLSGVIEVVDDDYEPSTSGRMLITAFHTKGTPLLKYDIGDSMTWANDEKCGCGRNTPIVKSIEGRVNDYLYSKERGKCNLGNLSNCVKYLKGVSKFQAIQKELDSILILVVTNDKYNVNEEKSFLKELRMRLGDSINIDFKYVKSIPREKSGKFRIVKSSINIDN